MLEVWDAADPFDAVARWLDERGFFDDPAADARADLFLAYRCSEFLRRSNRPAPPEPLRLPYAACRIRPATTDRAPESFALGDWEPTWSPREHGAAVEAVRAATSTR